MGGSLRHAKDVGADQRGHDLEVEPVVREGLRAMLATQPDMELVGEATTGTEAVERASALHPDVALMDLQMPELDGPAAIAPPGAGVGGPRADVDLQH